ncbi:MAG TPA: hypothetical protein VGS19_30460 [Streptosporangiaceae bacterium]|nr:hypothetical protein [Streptosporangiaceae bacterium]
MRPRAPRLGAALLMGALVAALASCTGQGHAAAPRPRVAPVLARLLAAMGDTTMYLLAGPEASANVYMLNHANPQGLRLTSNPSGFGISWISASPAGLLLGDARTSIDVTSIYRDHRSQPLPAGQTGAGAISPTGTIAYAAIPGNASGTGASTWRIELTTANGASSRVVYRQPAPDLGLMAWGSGNQLAVISSACHGRSQVLILDSSGRVRARLNPSLATTTFCLLAWNTRAPGLAIGYHPGLDITGTGVASELITLSGHQTLMPYGWLPMCWSPDGTSLLVARGLTIGLWHLNDPAQVRVLGSTGRAGPLSGCAWLTKPAVGT